VVPILSQIDPIHTISSYLSKIHFNIVHPPTSWSSQWSLSFWLSHQYPTCIPLLPHSGNIVFSTQKKLPPSSPPPPAFCSLPTSLASYGPHYVWKLLPFFVGLFPEAPSGAEPTPYSVEWGDELWTEGKRTKAVVAILMYCVKRRLYCICRLHYIKHKTKFGTAERQVVTSQMFTRTAVTNNPASSLSQSSGRAA
jgi:hypothetical protein